MSNSVVKVTDSTSTDSLLLLVGNDGTVTPSKSVVDAYLSSKSGATNLQVMHFNKSDGQTIEVGLNEMLYLPEAQSEPNEELNFDEIAYNLYNIKLDHDYTTHSEPADEVDELAKTLSILDGETECIGVKNIKFFENKAIDKNDLPELNLSTHTISTAKHKVLNNLSFKSSLKNHQKKVKPKDSPDNDDGWTKYNDEDENNYISYNSEENKKNFRKIPKADFKNKDNESKGVKQTDLFKTDKSQPITQETKSMEKKLLKKERRISKPAPDDFALFSTPDIIRRVGGKEATCYPPISPLSDSSGSENKPARIEVRSKSVSDSPCSSKKKDRLSLDGKPVEKLGVRLEHKLKDKKGNADVKVKRCIMNAASRKTVETTNSNIEDPNVSHNISDSNVELNNENKSYVSHLSNESSELSSSEHNIALDGNSLDLDPALLDNINNDLISEDILYQVAQSLVCNTELQNAIDKSLSEENTVLHTTVQEGLISQVPVDHDVTEQVTSTNIRTTQKGTHIVRPDGRIVVIPPIERPTTRSRNKRSSDDISSRFSGKPLDEQHVSGNELDSSGEDEEESEDDPNKLWCICNQPHNNRFMICCDTCEEWYHGKCVNITKAMGQQMESEGKEWICLFCKDPLLKRPQAAAKRIRKASRNSRQSSDSNGSTKVEAKSSSVPCVVCQKPSRSNSIFCSEACILIHAQGVERVVVFERTTGNMLTGNKAPSAANLEQWLKDHPGYEVVRSAGKIVTTKTPLTNQSKLRLLKNLHSDTKSAVFKNKTFSGGVIKTKNQMLTAAVKGSISGPKIVDKQIDTSVQKEKLQNSSLHKEITVSTPKVKVIQSSVKSNSLPNSREKIASSKMNKTIRQVEQTSSNTSQARQENIRENVQKTIFEQLTNRLKMVDDLKLSEENLRDISTEIESQLYKCFGDTGQKYRNKYRSLIFNIKDIKNQTLWRRICEKTINPYQLVRLSPDDLASQELALWREREAKHQLDMIKKSELELLKCNRQYVLKTHKGEQVLEDNRPTDHIDNTEVITSLTDGSNGEKLDRKSDSCKSNDRKSSKHCHKDKERKSNKEKNDSKSHHRHRSSSRDHDRGGRRRSRSRDKNSKHGERKRSRSRGREKHRRSSHKSSKHKKDSHRVSSTEKLDKKSKEILEQLVDNKIVPPLEDRLWKHVPQEDILPAPSIESDSDHEPTSTVTIPTPPRNSDSDEFSASQSLIETKIDKFVRNERSEVEETSPIHQTKSEEIWRGIINMIDVAQISITAHEVSGDCNGLTSELPSNLDIVGRISPDTVWDYIGKMKCSNSKVISVVRLNAINVEEKMPYLALYSYLSSRNRLGVVKSTNKAVKDFYILPLASQKPIPQALLPLNGPGFEEARPALLLGIIVRDKRKRPHMESASPAGTINKKLKTDFSIVQLTPPNRSYTPPPLKESRFKLPLPPTVTDQDGGDEPYSPEDSDPDNATSTTDDTSDNNNFLKSDVRSSQTFQPFTNKFDDIPGLENAALPSSTQEIQRQMEKLNKEIEMQKSEINSISQNIATASTEIGTTALANIALPSNLQQILDSIKTIGSSSTIETVDSKVQSSNSVHENSDFTIPLLLPTSFSRQSGTSTGDDFSRNTIPLNLPSKRKSTTELDKSVSVLSTLSEEDLIRKAEEMLKDSKTTVEEDSERMPAGIQSGANNIVLTQRLSKIDLTQPPIPGLDDTNI